MFTPTNVSLLQVPIRVALIYLALFLLLRLTGKRELGQLSPMDFLTILLLSETVSPSLVKQDTSITAGLLAAGMLLAITVVVERAVFRSRRLEEVLEGRPQVLFENGQVNGTILKRERISELELGMAIRREGIESLNDVAKAILEPTGFISVIKRIKD